MSARIQNRAAAAQLAAIGELFGNRIARCTDTEDWAIDTEEAGGCRGAVDIDVRLLHSIVYGTALITNPDVLAAVDMRKPMRALHRPPSWAPTDSSPPSCWPSWPHRPHWCR